MTGSMYFQIMSSRVVLFYYTIFYYLGSIRGHSIPALSRVSGINSLDEASNSSESPRISTIDNYTVSNFPKDTEMNKKKINALRQRGKDYISRMMFTEASSCYAAILQILDGSGGANSAELRRKCGLTLAECYFKLGKFYDAIARYSDVIDESPLDVKDGDIDIRIIAKEKSFRSAIGRAFFRRGAAFNHLNLVDFALIDFKAALNYLTGETSITKVVDMIKEIESEIDNPISDTESGSPDPVVDDVNILLMQDTIENIQLSYPRREMSIRKIELLSSTHDVATVINSFNLSSARSNIQGTDTFSSGLQGVLGFDSSDTGKGNGAFLGAGLGGLLGTGGFDLLEMLGKMAGLDSYTIKNVKEIFQAFKTVFKYFQSAMKFLKGNSTLIVTCVTVLWVFMLKF